MGDREGKESQLAAMRSVTAQLSRKKKSKWLLDPRSSRLAIWDLVGGLLLVYTALVCPFEVAFTESGGDANARFWINRIIDVFFLVDMIIQLFIMYPLEQSIDVDPKSTALKKTGVLLNAPRTTVEMVSSHKSIALHYFSGWFIIDMVSILTCLVDIIPVVQAGQAAAAKAIHETKGVSVEADTAAIEQLRILRVLRVLRLVKLIRLIKSSRILKRWQTSIALDFSTQTIISCTSSYLLAGHWFSCLLVLTASFADTPYYTWLGAKGFCVRAETLEDLPYGKTWVLQPPPLAAALAHLDDVYCVDTWGLWIHTYYWMIQLISGAAGGDTDAQFMTSSECVVFSILVVTSCLLMSNIIASFCDVLANLNPEHTVFRNQMDSLNRYCRTNKLNPQLRRNLREYLFRTKHVMMGNSQRELMLLLSPKLQGELSLQINGPWLTRVAFLRHVETGAVVQIALALEPLVFVPTEILPSENMYYLENGTVVHRGSVMLGGSVWGTDCFLNRAELRSRPARALTHAEVARIHRDKLKEIIYTNVERVDQNGQPIIIYTYPAAVRRLRWETIRTGLIRELNRRKEEEGVKDKWGAAFEAMDSDAVGLMGGAEAEGNNDNSVSISPVRRFIKSGFQRMVGIKPQVTQPQVTQPPSSHQDPAVSVASSTSSSSMPSHVDVMQHAVEVSNWSNGGESELFHDPSERAGKGGGVRTPGWV
jgi:hypothetical protein